MSKETLSMKQALQIINEDQIILRSTSMKMSIRNSEFVNQVSHIWEDKNAVDLFKKHKQNMEGFIDELQENGNIFANTVKDIADSYAVAGGKSERLSFTPIRLQKDIDVSKIKEFFADGENGDDFGFVNPETGPDQVMEAWDSLVADLRNIASEAVERIKAINAFGNADVQLRLAESAGKVVEILNGHIEASKKVVAEYIAKSALAYGKVGAAAGAVLGGLGKGAIESGSGSSGGITGESHPFLDEIEKSPNGGVMDGQPWYIPPTDGGITGESHPFIDQGTNSPNGGITGESHPFIDQVTNSPNGGIMDGQPWYMPPTDGGITGESHPIADKLRK